MFKLLRRIFSRIGQAFKEPELWKYDYLNRTEYFGPFLYTPMMVAMQDHLNQTDDPPGNPVGKSPPPSVKVVAPEGIINGSVYITNPQTGNPVKAYYHYGMNEIRTAVNGWEAGLTPQVAEHEFAHWFDAFRTQGEVKKHHHKEWFGHITGWGN